MTQTKPAAAVEERLDTEPPRSWNVVLLDDQHHSYEYVIQMVTKLFRRSTAEAREIALRVDTRGRAVLLTTHKEHAELKRDQVHGFGRDERIAECSGSMSAIIEPADDGPDDEANGGGNGRA